MNGISMLVLSVGGIIAVLFFVTYAAQKHDLNGIKDKTVGNGQHGTARWATRQEIQRTYHHVPFTPEEWRQAAKNGNQPTANGKPLPQGIVHFIWRKRYDKVAQSYPYSFLSRPATSCIKSFAFYQIGTA